MRFNILEKYYLFLEPTSSRLLQPNTTKVITERFCFTLLLNQILPKFLEPNPFLSWTLCPSVFSSSNKYQDLNPKILKSNKMLFKHNDIVGISSPTCGDVCSKDLVQKKQNFTFKSVDLATRIMLSRNSN
jgi:hypothetical protein